MFDKSACMGCLTIKELMTLHEISSIISNHYDLQTSLEKSMKILKNTLNLDNCVVHIIEDDILNVFAAVELSKIQKNLASYKIGEGATGMAAESNEPVVVENIHNNSLFLNKSGKRDFNGKSYVAVPLMIDNESIGVLGAVITKTAEIDLDDTVRILAIVGSIFAQTIHSYQLNQKEKERLQELKLYYKMEWDSKVHNFGDIIGDSPKMQQVFKVIQRIAQSDVTVLVRGETGTGKELVAAAIHKRSKRKDEPFIKLNCAAITDTLLESELFGHEKGAFTDARETRKGRFELADGGTLFLDEIGDISASAQVKLLRVLQEREFERVGGSKTIKVNVRLVAATNRNLEQMVKDGKFREDLYYRLNVIPIDLPPLRERGEDIKQLVNFFLERSIRNHKKMVTITDEAMDALCDYPWPGNVRELENTLERIVLMGNEEGINKSDMLLLLPALFDHKLKSDFKPISKKTLNLEELEKDAIIEALENNDFNHSSAALELGITLRQIGYKIKNMKSKITYKNEELELTDDFVDIGYMADNFDAVDINNNEVTIKKASPNRNIQLFLSFPFFDEFSEEIITFDEFISAAKIDIFTYVIFSEKTTLSYKFKKLIPIFDINEEFANMYGTKIVSGTLENRLTKALFLIGKDGAIYHIDMPENLEKPLDLEKIRLALNKAYHSYTGAGCHG